MAKNMMYKKVFLDNLPKCENKTSYIDWKNSVGYKVKFIYNTFNDSIEGEIEIIEYKQSNKSRNKRLVIKYKDNITEMAPGQFTRCEIGVLLNKINHEHMYPIGAIINDVNSGVLEIKEHLKIGKKKYKAYKYTCKTCGNEDIVSESNLINNKVGCNFCAGKKVLKGKNDLWTTHPYIAKYLKNPEEGYEISHGCNKKKYFKCPHCGFERKATINDITSDGFSCTSCGDGISFPEKVMSNLLNQLGVQYIKEKSFKWSQGKRYDFYIPFINCIIETHGKQHYTDGFNNIKARKVIDEQMNDKIKFKLALDNNIKYYIVVDCRESEISFIKNNILHSELNNIFNLTKINWNKCAEFAVNNLVKEVCNMWNSLKTISDIADFFKMNRSCVRNYLKKGQKLGWCDYDPKTNNRDSKSKKVICLNDKNIYYSICEASRNYNISDSTINLFCNGKILCNDEILNNTYLQWQFYNDYLINPKELLSKEEIDMIKNNNIYTKKVVCLNNRQIFNSLKEASEWANIKNSSGIIGYINSKYKFAGKHPETGEPLRWIYYDEYIKQQELMGITK